MSCFFRVLIIRDWATKLRIPRLFVSSFSLTPKGVTLINNASSRRLWIVDMEEEEEKGKTELYFKTGWAEFVKDNALETGDFIVFEFDGDSKFKVTLFGKSACEKKVEIGRNHHHHYKRKGKDPIDAERQPAKPKLDDDVEIKEETLDFDDYGASSSQERWDQDEEEEEDDEDEEESDGCVEIKPEPHDSIGEDSNLLGPEFPSFRVHLQPAYAKKGCMCIPTEFLKKHIRRIERQEVEIETVNGIWTVTLLPHKKRSRTFARFSKGWSDFARENAFNTGQTLVFQMIRTGKCPKFILTIHSTN